MRQGRLNVQRIQTPEGITFSLRLAGVGRRALAWAIDVALLLVIKSLLSMLLLFSGVIFWSFGRIGLQMSLGMIGAMFALVGIGYRIVLEWYWQGKTVGKKIMGLRVVDEFGLQLQFSQVVIRNILRIVDFLPFLNLIGGSSIFWSRNSQRLGDLAGSTIVVMTSRQFQPNLDKLLSGKYNSFRDHPHLAARLRQRVTAQEAQLALGAVLRRDQLQAADRAEVFREYAEYLREKVKFPEEVLLGLSDERFVQNTVDIVYRPRLDDSPAESAATENGTSASVVA